MNAPTFPLDCNDVMQLIDPAFKIKTGYLPPGCCTSCHEDVEYGYPLCATGINGQDAEICCAVLSRWEAST